MKSCRILFVAINARYTHSNPALLYLKKNIEDLEFETSVLEFTTGKTEKQITEIIKSFKPDVLALSVYIWNTLKVKKLLETIKLELPEVIVVLGGPEVSFNSGEWLNTSNGFDYIITGGGEQSFRNLALSGFTSGSRIIPGLNPHFSMIKFPYNSEDMKRLSGRYIYYESSRGCPFKCSYCLSSESESNVEFRTIEQIMDELDFFSAFNPPLIKFVDRTFNINKNHYRPVWDYIVKKFKGKDTCFHFEIFPDLLDKDDLDFLSGVPRDVFQFEMGIQSTKPETLKEINRPGSWDRAETNIRILLDNGNIHIHTDLIAGLPFENITDFAGSFNRVYALGTDHLQSGFLKILPGTEMCRRVDEYGIKFRDLPPYEIIENKWVSAVELEVLRNIGELVDLVYNSGKFTETEKFMVYLYGSAFKFYRRTAGLFRKKINALHRHWEYIAEIFREMIKCDFPGNYQLLTDYLRWDWCSSMKDHHYPGLLKSEVTIKAKRKGISFFTGYSIHKIINFRDFSFSADDLKRSIFFIPETEVFLQNMMRDKMALFLPDRRIIFFDPDARE